MYLPRDLISHLYNHLIRSQHAQSPPVLLLVALEPDALCACRILTALLKRDYIQHNIVPVSGYGDLARAGEMQVQPMRTQNGGSGGTVICLGVGGLVDLGAVLGLEATEEDEDATGGVEIWVIDARRPWNLGNVFGGKPPETALREVNGNARAKAPDVNLGQIQRHYKPGRGGIIVYDDGDINEELGTEKEAYFQLDQLPPIDDDGRESDGSDTESDSDGGVALNDGRSSKKRKSSSDAEDDEESGDEDVRPRQRRRSNSEESISISPTRPPRRGLLSISNNDTNGRTTGSRSPSPTFQPILPAHDEQKATRRNRRRLLRLKRKYEAVLHSYYSLGASYSEPISSLLYSLAGEIGREDNNFLWHAIVGVSSLELYGRSMTGVGISTSLDAGGSAGWGGERGERIRQVLRDEVRRLNPPDPTDAKGEAARGETSGVIPTTARSPTDTSIRLSPEPRFLLIRHWSLYDSMLHSPYLASRLHLWSDTGRKRLHKLLAKMGVSLVQSRQSYTHMDMDLKKGLRQRLLKYAPMYSLDGLVPPPASAGRGREGWGFVRSWGFKACLSAVDVGVIVGAILEVGKAGAHLASTGTGTTHGWDGRRAEKKELVDEDGRLEGEEYVERFWTAYDALENVEALKHSLPHAQHLHRAILRTGSALLAKRHIRHLKAFRMAVVKDGPDVALFTHPGALTKLALWLGDAIAAQEKDAPTPGRGTPLVLAGLNDARGVYIVVGTGGGGGVVDWEGRRERAERRALAGKRKAERAARRAAAAAAAAAADAAAGGGAAGDDEDAADEESEEEEDDDNDDDEEREQQRGYGRNRFGNAFQEVVDETNARVRIDSFEHCVVEVRKEDLSAFLESLSMKAVVG
ncbi:hypothetical protein MMC15_007489 [Xylographa vitiligo]|nr:hypothetical protein [Xylographa vitiligo]